jgi:hypothetical protein
MMGLVMTESIVKVAAIVVVAAVLIGVSVVLRRNSGDMDDDMDGEPLDVDDY